jgi:hypothetical protein
VKENSAGKFKKNVSLATNGNAWDSITYTAASLEVVHGLLKLWKRRQGI